MSFAILARWAALSLLLLALILVPFFFYEQTVNDWTAAFIGTNRPSWTVGLTLGSLLALDIVLPVPSSVVSTAAGYLLGVAKGTLVGWTGMTLGCLLGYTIGSYGGRPLARRFVGDSELERAVRVHSRHGDWALIALRSVPVLAEASVIFAGIVRVPFRRFVALTCLSNLGISAAYAAVGAYAVQAESFLLAFAGAVFIPAVAIFCARWRGL